MNSIFSSLSRLRGLSYASSVPLRNLGVSGFSPLRSFSSCLVPRATLGSPGYRCGPIVSSAEGRQVFQQLPGNYQQIRTRKRGTEYQPKNIKRKRTHGWIKRLSSQGGIEVILRRMLKGRKSLSH
ncbi:39S ribosomal protein L34, mitochondrial [Synchiropus splendidus]|uniref:39S ribosomal protein L34, mitochondrial n=1 Tax=Synchiropus splendidus TaxID=270530 RepID=UPI00237D7264|nr:39S ribosomal protein L34, mitochondrial [Synchiropus splendidus]